MVEPVADNACAPDWRVPVDVRGRGEDRVWVTTGRHVVSIDLASKRPLRVWDLDVCALRIVMADRNEATIVAASREDSGYSSRFLRIDKQGVHELPEYGRIAGLVADVVADRYGRLWWYDRASGAFVCRTPLGQAE